MRLASLLLLFSLPLAGCPSTPVRCKTGFLGDPAKPIVIELVKIDQDEVVRDVAACGAVDIVKPPQGGKVIFIGVRATNLDGCGIDLNAALRDPATQQVIGAEERTVNLVPIAARAGWGETSASGNFHDVGYSDFANIAVCPNVTARDVQRDAHLLDVKVTDKAGRVGRAQMIVVPRCAQTDPIVLAECECTCERGYRIDKCENVTSWDAGVADAASCPPMSGMDGGVDAGNR